MGRMSTGSLTLVSHALCPYVQRAAIVLMEKNAAFKRLWVDLAQKPAWFLAVSPLGKTPVLLVDEAGHLRIRSDL
jgi:glutathione S-transferase